MHYARLRVSEFRKSYVSRGFQPCMSLEHKNFVKYGNILEYIGIILKQKSLATQNLVDILFIIKIPVLKIDLKRIFQVCLHVNYPLIVMLD